MSSSRDKITRDEKEESVADVFIVNTDTLPAVAEHHHHHHHHHHHAQSSWTPGKIFRVLTQENNWKTNASFAGEILTQSCNSYEIGEITDYIASIFTSLTPYFLEISEEGFWVFVAFAIFTSIGASVCHLAQNYNNQDDDAPPKKKKAAEHKEAKEEKKSAAPVRSHAKNKHHDLEENLLSEEEKHIDSGDVECCEDEECKEEDEHEHHNGLRWYDWIFLAGDAAAHTIETTSPIVYTVNVFFTDIGYIGKFVTLGGALAVGLTGCKADVHSCYRFLKTGEHDHADEDENENKNDIVANGWTNFAAFADTLTSCISNPVSIGKFVDAFGGLFFTMTPISDIVTLSAPALGIGVAFTTILTTANTITHRRFNTNCQHGHQVKLLPEEKKTKLNWPDKWLVKFDFAYHVFNVAAKPTLLVETWYKKEPMSRLADCLTKGGFFAVGVVCSFGTSTTCENQTKRFIFRRDIKPNWDKLKKEMNANPRPLKEPDSGRESPNDSLIELPQSSSSKNKFFLRLSSATPVPHLHDSLTDNTDIFAYLDNDEDDTLSVSSSSKQQPYSSNKEKAFR